jgi:ABC-type sulfate transport system permease component
MSSGLVALAFVDQATKLAGPFLLFAGVCFATLYVIRLLTFLRIVQTAVEDTLRARGISRISHHIWRSRRNSSLTSSTATR